MPTAERRRIALHRNGFDAQTPGAVALEAIFIPLLEDFGTGLDLSFYEEAVTHLLGGEATVVRDVEVIGGDRPTLGTQRLRLCAPEAAFRLTPSPLRHRVFPSTADDSCDISHWRRCSG